MEAEQIIKLRNSTYVNRFLTPFETLHTQDTFYTLVVQQIVNWIRPTTVLVVGQDSGILVEYLGERDIQAWGVHNPVEKPDPLNREVGRQWESDKPFEQKYDLIVCIEALTGMPTQDVEKAITNICQHTEDILFSSTPFYIEGIDASCIHPPEFWADQFAKNGFFHDLDYSSDAIFPWAMRLRKANPNLAELVANYEHHLWLLSQENQARRAVTLGLRFEVSHIQKELHFRIDEVRRELQHRLGLVQNEIRVMRNSRGWQALEFLRGIRNRLGFKPKA